MQARRLIAVAFGLSLAASPAAADVQLTMHGGRVSISAKNATVSQILAEWAKVGQTRIVNGERVPGGPVTIELTDVPEIEAIGILLRSVGGYLLAPRRAVIEDASQYDRILILPVSSPQRSAPAAAPTPAAATRPPQFIQPPPFSPPSPPANDDNDEPPSRPNPAVPGADPRPPVFNTFPQPARPNSQPPPSAPTATPTMPAGVSTPGMIVPVPPAAGQPTNPTPQ